MGMEEAGNEKRTMRNEQCRMRRGKHDGPFCVFHFPLFIFHCIPKHGVC